MVTLLYKVLDIIILPMHNNPLLHYRATIVWALAMVLAIFGNSVLWNADPGVNWGLWVVSVVVVLTIVTRSRYGRVDTPMVVAGTWSIVLAFGLAMTTQQEITFLLIVATLVLLAIALVTTGRSSLDAFVAKTAISAPSQAVRFVMHGAVSELAESSMSFRSRYARPAIRGVFITVPIVIVLFAVLADADPLFGAIGNHITSLLADVLSIRTAFFLLLFGTTLGAYGGVSRGVSAPPVVFPSYPVQLGGTERRVLLLSVASVVWLFVASAIASQWADPAARAGTGITYADYARRGFGELSIAATLVVAVVLSAERFGTRDDTLARRTSLAALAAVGVMLGIAFTRIVRYEWAYGYTMTRVYAQAYMVVVGCALIILALEVAKRIPQGQFTYRTATAALVIFTVSVYVNTEAWVVNRNIDRYVKSGQLDVRYLTQDLSADAIPALVARVGGLHDPERRDVTMWLRCDAPRWTQHDNRWFAWNIRISHSAQALRAFNVGQSCVRW
jgi:hypothetical protein